MNQKFRNYLESLTPKKRDLACEAVQMYLQSEGENVDRIQTATNVYNLCHDMALLDIECFDVLCLNHNFKLLKRARICQGGITEVLVDIRVLMREVLLSKATIIMCVHNHPSGKITPSKCDDDLTKQIQNACQIMRIHLADHVIIGDGTYYSYHEYGKV